MDRKEVQKYVDNRRKVAQAYFDQGLLQESQDIFRQIARNLHYIKKRMGNSSDVPFTWFQDIEKELQEKIELLEKEIASLGSSSDIIHKDKDEEESPKTMYLKGVGLKELGFQEEALACFHDSLKGGHQPYECLKEILEVYKQKKDLKNGLHEFKASLELYDLKPKEKDELLSKLGALYEKSNPNEQALDAGGKDVECKAEAESVEVHEQNHAPERIESSIEENLPGTPSSSPSPSGSDTREEIVMEEGQELKDEITLEPAVPPSTSDPSDTPEVKALQEQIEQLKAEIKRLNELSDEYQKRYQSIISTCNALQKENRELKEKRKKTNAKKA